MRVNYLAFCVHCGVPKQVPRHVIRQYWVKTAVIYCDNCGDKSELPTYLKKITNELIKGVKD